MDIEILAVGVFWVPKAGLKGYTDRPRRKSRNQGRPSITPCVGPFHSLTILLIRQAAWPPAVSPSELLLLSLQSSESHRGSISQARPLRLERSNDSLSQQEP